MNSFPISPSFIALLSSLHPCFPRRQTFDNFVAIMAGWVLALGRGTLSSALVAADLTTTKHWSAWYRFFSRSRWSLDELGLKMAELVVDRFVSEGTILVAGDDTLHAKGGAKVFGAAMHHDALSSTKQKVRFQYGHCWVVLAIVVRLPFTVRPWALPVLFRLNTTKKMAKRWGLEHRKKTEQLAELVTLLAGRFPDRRFHLVGDNLYSCKTVLSVLPENVELIGRLRLDAELLGPVPPPRPGQRGRPRKWGDRLPSPLQVAENDEDWQKLEVSIYRKQVTVRIKTRVAWWRSAGHLLPIRYVVVFRPRGQYPYEVFFCTDASLSCRQIIETYAARWSIEVASRETKQSLGVEHSQPWTKPAVLRTAPTAMLLYPLVILWYTDHGHDTAAAAWPRRPWYAHKQTASFADMLATLRRASLLPAFSRNPAISWVPGNPTPDLARWFQEAA